MNFNISFPSKHNKYRHLQIAKREKPQRPVEAIKSYIFFTISLFKTKSV